MTAYRRIVMGGLGSGGRGVAVGGLAALIVLLGACTGGSGEPRQPPSPPSSPDAPVTSPSVAPPGFPMPTLPPTPLVPPRPAPPPEVEATLTGEVTEGVTAGCVVLQTEHGDYLLLGEAVDDLRMGAIVRVRGQVRTDLATICQQGTPFEVTEVLD